MELRVSEPGEECIDEKKLYRFLSNSKQSIGGQSNRDWWRQNVIWGFYHFWCSSQSKVTVFNLFVGASVSELVLRSRLVKVVGLDCDVSVQEVSKPVFPRSTEGYKCFMNDKFPACR